MKYILALALFLISTTASASTVVSCQTGTDDGLQVADYRVRADTSLFNGDSKNLINPDLSALSGVSISHWKCSGGGVVEMSVSEKATLAATVATAKISAIRSLADNHVDSLSVNGVHLRASMLVVMDEINILRAQHSLSDRTLSQLKTAVKAKISSGAAD